MRRTVLSFVVGGMLVATQLPAQVTLGPVAPVIGVDPVSTYLFRGQDVTESAAIQPFASFGFGNSGLSLGVWSSFAVADRDVAVPLGIRGSLDEVDLTASFSRAVGPASLGVGYIAYIFPASRLDYTTQEVFGSLGLPGIPLAPTVSVYYDFDGGEAPDADLIEGVYTSVGVGQRFPIGLPLDVGANLGWTNQEAIRTDPAINDFNVWAGVPIPFQGLTVTPTVGFTHLFNDALIAPDGEGTVWAKIQLRLP